MEDLKQVSWPGWETVGILGRGSFGTVYEIRRNVFKETERAALKVISIPQNDSEIQEMYNDGYDAESITNTFQNHLENIVTEYSLMRKMNGSANIISCDDVRYIQHDDGIGWDIFIKMELLTPLAQSLGNQISEVQVIKLGRDICAALELCRKHGIIHRDIKPQNIYMSPNGDYKLGDFGIAKIAEKTMGGTKIGTYKYMAPEVYNNQPYGQSVDIYSLGLVLYWLMNERRMPFLPLPPAKVTATQDEDARRYRFSGVPLPPPKNGSEALKRIVLKACAFDPAQRYQTAAQMSADLDGLMQQQKIPAQKAPVQPPVQKPVQPPVQKPVQPPVQQPKAPAPQTVRPPVQPPVQQPKAPAPQTVRPPVQPPVQQPKAPAPQTVRPPVQPPVQQPKAPAPQTVRPPVQPPVQQPKAPAPQTVRPPVQPPVQKPAQPPVQKPKPPRRRRKVGLWIFLGILAFVLAVVGLMVFFLFLAALMESGY